MTRPIAIIGDIHGEATKLKELISQLRSRFGMDIDLYGVGDFIDRGPDSKTVLQICVDEDIKGVMGNHETWLFEYATENTLNMRFACYPMIGGRATLRSYGVPDSVHGSGEAKEILERTMPFEHRKFIRDLPLYRKVEVGDWTVWITHAGIKSSTAVLSQRFHFDNDDFVEAIAQTNTNALLWEHFDHRAPRIWAPGANQIQVFGHTAIPNVMDWGYFVAVDTGCGRKRHREDRPNALSCVVVHPDGRREIFVSQVPLCSGPT